MKIQEMVGKKIGFVRIEKPVEHTQTFEVAAWWRKLLSDTGDFDLYLSKERNGRYTAYAKVPATVSDNYTAPLWGGVAFAPSRSEKGQRQEIYIGVQLEIAAGRMSLLMSEANKKLDFVIDRELLESIAEYTEERMNYYIGYLQQHALPDYQAKPRSKFNSELSQVGYAGKEISYWEDATSEILREQANRFGYFAKYEKVQNQESPIPAVV